MSLQQETELLRGIPMFRSMDATRLKLLSFTSERVSFMPGEEFITEGEMGDSAYVIMSGECEVVIGGVEVAEMGPNNLVGEIALLHQGRRTATLRARTPVTCLKLSKDVFFHLVRELPDFAVAIMRDLAIRLDQRSSQFRDALKRSGH